jgi:hypothetical protein
VQDEGESERKKKPALVVAGQPSSLYEDQSSTEEISREVDITGRGQPSIVGG